jgi:glycosyltransferase involved in cell wall biosynthesis
MKMNPGKGYSKRVREKTSHFPTLLLVFLRMDPAFQSRQRQPANKKEQRMSGPDISIVVCTYNRADVLGFCLDGFEAQSIEKGRFEVLVIDNNCTDGTRELVQKRQTGNPWLRYIVETSQGLSHARNCGIEQAHSDLISFVDDDAIPHVDFVAETLLAFEKHPRAMCIGGKIKLQTEVPLPEWIVGRFDRYLGYYDIGDEPVSLLDKEGPFGSNMTFKREAFSISGLFDTKLGRSKELVISNEDYALVEKLKISSASCMYWPKAVVTHIVPTSRMTRRWMFKRIYYQGVSDAYMEANIRQGLVDELRYIGGKSRDVAYLLLKMRNPYSAASVACHLLGETYTKLKMSK